MEKLIRKDYSLGEVVTVYPAVVKKFNDMELAPACGNYKSQTNRQHKQSV